MIRKTAQFTQASELRKRGFTYDEIAKIVNVSKSTVSSWLSRETWSTAITIDNKKRAAKENQKRISLLNTARATQFKKLYAETERSASIEFQHYKRNSLFIAGLSVYMGCGDYTSTNLIRITTSRKEVHRIFIKFAVDYLGVSREKIRFWLLLRTELEPAACSVGWSKILNIPLTQFHKHQTVAGDTTKHPLHDGVGNTIIGSTVLKRKLIKWIELSSKEL